VVRAVAILGLGAAVAGCGAESSRRVPATKEPIVAALAVTPRGIVTGELTSGRIRAANGRVLARIPVSTGGQRGLLGLAARGAQLYAASTARGPGRRIVIDRVLPSRRRVWLGPSSATLANGGHLVLAPDGRLVIGIGDRQSAPRSGRLLSLDPDGAPQQRPRILSSGWNNPFAFAFLDGVLWVADNAPGRLPERLARGDAGRPVAVTPLPARVAPSGLAALPDGSLAVCGVVSGRLDRYVREARRWRRGASLGHCRYGVARAKRGIVVSTDRGLQTLPLP
jgi:hypothetical protein